MKKVIWILGSNACGKTSQSKLIHENCNGTKVKEIKQIDFINENDEDEKTFVTIYDKTSHVGKVEDNQCTGTDSLNKRSMIEMAYLYLVLSTTVETIVIDGILATATWSPMIHQVNSQQKVQTILILLNYKSVEANYARLKQRRANKTGEPIESIVLSENTQSNVLSKYKGFKNMYEKIKDQFNVSVEIDADLPAMTIHRRITQIADL